MIDLHNFTNGHVARRQAERMAMGNPSRDAQPMSVWTVLLGVFTCVCFLVVFWAVS